MIDISGLNPEQYEAVTTIDGPLMILAGAGTGKTRVITFRIGHMLDRGISPDQIVALTFTNKAAREMKERVKELVGRAASGLRIGTFHSFCISLLRQFHDEAGLDRGFSLAGMGDQIDLIRRAIEEKGWQGLYKPEELLNRISSAKNELLRPEEILNHPGFCEKDEDPELLAQVYALYERQLRLHRVIDFDDCILKVAHMLDSNPKVLETLQQSLTHFMVDEYQDTNFSQLAVLEKLAAKHQNICVVGDDDQSIYSWRGAMVETIDRFEQIFPKTKLIKLEQNYRCTNIILDAANHVIQNNKQRKDKTLWSQNISETYISLVSKADDASEAKWIAEKCFGLLGQGYKPKDIGILYRANNQARALEVALREMNIPYKIYGGSSFFERKEVKDFLAYFKLTVNPDDRMALWRIINTPSRGVGLKTLEKIEETAREHQLSPFAVLEQNLVDLKGKAGTALPQLIQLIRKFSRTMLIQIEDLEARGHEIIKAFGLEQDIRLKVSHEGSRQRKMESLKRLPSWLKRMGEFQVEDKGSLHLVDLLDYLMLSDDASKKEEKGNENHVSLMTIHASKGLEFPAVFVCGLEEDLLPHKNSVGTALGLSEERRLFYVAITRAKEKLHLSFARERYSQFQRLSKRPSRFLKELPEAGIVAEDIAASMLSREATETERKQKNLRRFASLRDSLKGGFQ